MKLSDAIMTGISAFNLRPELWMCKDGGCLLGIGGLAAGAKWGESDSLAQIIHLWPWLREEHCIPNLVHEVPELDLPFNWLRYLVDTKVDAVDIISYLAHHVKLGNVSVEKVVDWVASVEPQEEQTDGGKGPVQAALEVQAV